MDSFTAAADPFRRELTTHCYRMLGSMHDAEDAVQETMIRGWRAYGRYDETKASMRTWLHRIATNVCLTALANRSRRVLPAGLRGPGADPGAWPLEPAPEIPWLEPLPGTLLDIAASDPAAVVTARNSVRLAFVAALQALPPKQRAVLVLRDVLAWSAAEVAEALETTSAAVNSTLQRARAQLAQTAPSEDTLAEPDDPAVRALVDRYVDMLQRTDITGLADILRSDAILEMPPVPDWFQGADAIGRFLLGVFDRRGAGRAVGISANGQPALAFYFPDPDGSYFAHSVHVIGVSALGIDRLSVFFDPELFERFGLPTTLTFDPDTV